MERKCTEVFQIVGKRTGGLLYDHFETPEAAIAYKRKLERPSRTMVVCTEIYNFYEGGTWIKREVYTNPITEEDYAV